MATRTLRLLTSRWLPMAAVVALVAVSLQAVEPEPAARGWLGVLLQAGDGSGGLGSNFAVEGLEGVKLRGRDTTGAGSYAPLEGFRLTQDVVA